MEAQIEVLNAMAQRLWALGGSSFNYDYLPEMQEFYPLPRINQPFKRADEMGRDSRLLSMRRFLEGEIQLSRSNADSE